MKCQVRPPALVEDYFEHGKRAWLPLNEKSPVRMGAELRSLGRYLPELQIKDKKFDGENVVRRDRPDDEQLARLQSGLVLAGLNPAEAIPLLAPLLNLGVSAKYPPRPRADFAQFSERYAI
jgi:hypothetical protein